MVVDDDRSFRISLLRLLKTLGYRVIDAASGTEAMEKASCTAPAVILMDLHMDNCGGVAVTRALKANPLLANIPVILLTATPPPEAELDRLFHAILDKPCTTSILSETLERALASQ